MTFEELNAVWILREKLRGEECKLQSLYESRNRLTSPLNDGMPRNPRINSVVENLIILIADSERIVANLTSELNKQIDRTTALIVKTFPDPLAQTILLQRYVFGFDFTDIATHVGYSKRTVYRIHRNLMNFFD